MQFSMSIRYSIYANNTNNISSDYLSEKYIQVINVIKKGENIQLLVTVPLSLLSLIYVYYGKGR